MLSDGFIGKSLTWQQAACNTPHVLNQTDANLIAGIGRLRASRIQYRFNCTSQGYWATRISLNKQTGPTVVMSGSATPVTKLVALSLTLLPNLVVMRWIE